MEPLTIVLLVILGIGAVVVFWGFGVYNGLVRLKNQVKNAWSQIDVQLKRRYDLIPNLVETCKGYMKHERETLEAVIAARNQAANAGSPKEIAKAEGELSGLLTRLFALSENYPDLKANQNMLSLQEELTATENKISFARQHYNDSVMRFNNSREVAPNNLIAGFFNFKEAELFDAPEAEKAAPTVRF